MVKVVDAPYVIALRERTKMTKSFLRKAEGLATKGFGDMAAYYFSLAESSCRELKSFTLEVND